MPIYHMHMQYFRCHSHIGSSLSKNSLCPNCTELCSLLDMGKANIENGKNNKVKVHKASHREDGVEELGVE